MTPVFIDSNVLLDLLDPRSEWCRWSGHHLSELADTARLLINPIVFAEISINFAAIEDVRIFLGDDIDVEEPPLEAAFLAGKAFRSYRRRGGMRRSPLPDFFIGAHAAVCGYRLLTRDARRYRGYFPGLSLIAPAAP